MKKITLLVFGLITIHSSSQVLVGSQIQGAGREHLGVGCSINSDGTYFAGSMVSDDYNIINGTTRIYTRSGTTNTLQQSITGDSQLDFFGYSTAMNGAGDRMIISGFRKDNGATADVGQIKVYKRTGTTWSILGSPILGDNASDVFGFSVAMSTDGAVIAVGAPNSDINGSDSGLVKIYVWNTTTLAWTQRGTSINGEAAGDQYGISVALSQNGNFLIIGGRNNDGGGSNSGHVRVFSFNGSGYAQRGADINGTAVDDLFGSSVGISDNGSQLVVGAPRKASTTYTDAGAVFCYNWNGTSYAQRGQAIFSTVAGQNHFGSSVSMSADGNTIAVGAPNYVHNTSTGDDDRGFANCFRFDTATSLWNQLGNTVAGSQYTDVELGTSVAISKDGNYAVFGAPNTVLRGYFALYDFTTATLATENFSKIGFKLFPNPVKSTFAIEGDTTIKKLIIYNLLGQKVKTFTNRNTYSIVDLKSGTYLLEVTTEKGTAQTKIVKE